MVCIFLFPFFSGSHKKIINSCAMRKFLWFTSQTEALYNLLQSLQRAFWLLPIFVIKCIAASFENWNLFVSNHKTNFVSTNTTFVAVTHFQHPLKLCSRFPLFHFSDFHFKFSPLERLTKQRIHSTNEANLNEQTFAQLFKLKFFETKSFLDEKLPSEK